MSQLLIRVVAAVATSLLLALGANANSEEVSKPKIDPIQSTKSGRDPTTEDSSLPKGAEALRQLILDTNRRIDATEVSIKQSEVAMSLVEELQSQISKSKYEPLPYFTALESAAKSRDESSIKSTVERVYFEFLGSAFGFGVRVNSQDLAPGSFGRRIFTRTQQRISDIGQKYQKQLQDGLPVGFPLPLVGFESGKAAPVVLSEKDLAKFRAVASAENKGRLDAEVQSEVSTALSDLSQDLSKNRNELGRLLQLRDRINEASDKVKKEINELAITLGLPLFCSTVVLLFLIPFIAQHIRRVDANGTNLPGSFQFSTLVEISTVLLLTMSILILGLAGKLEPAVLGTLLGGISGYVLNRTNTRNRSSATSE